MEALPTHVLLPLMSVRLVPSLNVPVAVNCCDCPTLIVGLAGVTVMEMSDAARTGAAVNASMANKTRNGSNAVVRYFLVVLNVLQIR